MFHQARHRTSGCYHDVRDVSVLVAQVHETKEALSMGTQGLMGRRTMIPNAVPVNNVIVLYSAYHFMFNYCLIFNVSQ